MSHCLNQRQPSHFQHATLDIGGSASYENVQESRAEQVDRFQRIVNENQLARLNKMIDVLDDHILGTPHDFRYVIIDDLDLEWVDERIANPGLSVGLDSERG